MTSPEPRRRNRTRQRRRLLELLRASESHPTAADLHQALLTEFPRISLGTVYRNLDVLASEGQVEVVPSAGGPLRYDGNPHPHHHMTCERCGRISDVELEVPAHLAGALQREHAFDVRRVRIDFTGLCRVCRGTVDDPVIDTRP